MEKIDFGPYTLIRTNIDAKTVDDIARQARVILLGERHQPEDEVVTDRTVNYCFQAGDRLYTENLPYVRFVKGHLEKTPLFHAKTWGLPQNNRLRNLASLEWHLIKKIALLPDFYTGKKGKKAYEDMIHCISKIGVSTQSAWDQLGPEQAMDAILPVCLKAVKAYRAEINRVVAKIFCARNDSMIKKILESCKGVGRVFVIAGSAHFQYSARFPFKAVDAIYGPLEKQKIPYIALKVTDKSSVTFSKDHVQEQHHRELEARKKYSQETRQKIASGKSSTVLKKFGAEIGLVS